MAHTLFLGLETASSSHMEGRRMRRAIDMRTPRDKIRDGLAVVRIVSGLDY